ncbi:MAG: hypothetical protein K0S41_3252 [Anaerocolumna sp.]|jgi:hypothetical protein|nr:hypothetical protein [Anaerocolumna sp.]
MYKSLVKKVTFIDLSNKGKYNKITKWSYQLRNDWVRQEGIAILLILQYFFLHKSGTTNYKSRE